MVRRLRHISMKIQFDLSSLLSQKRIREYSFKFGYVLIGCEYAKQWISKMLNTIRREKTIFTQPQKIQCFECQSIES